MARARDIRPEFFTDEKVGALPHGARLLFAAIWCHADLRGTFERSPRQLRVLAFPFDEGLMSEGVDGWLCELERLGMLGRFDAGGKAWGHVTKWLRHQTPSAREVEIWTTRPEPPGWSEPTAWDGIIANAITKGRAKPERFQNRSRTVPGTVLGTVPGTVPDEVRNSSRNSSRNTTPSPSPSPSPTPEGGRGSACAQDPPTPPASDPVEARKSKNREALRRELMALCLPASAEAVEAWAVALQGSGGCRTADEVLDGINWVVTRARSGGVEQPWPRNCAELIKAWSASLAKARKPPPPEPPDIPEREGAA